MQKFLCVPVYIYFLYQSQETFQSRGKIRENKQFSDDNFEVCID